jgi:hypothetical protein
MAITYKKLLDVLDEKEIPLKELHDKAFVSNDTIA